MTLSGAYPSNLPITLRSFHNVVVSTWREVSAYLKISCLHEKDRMTIIGCIFTLVTLLSSGSIASAAWWVLDPSHSFKGSGGQPVNVRSVTIDMKTANLQILSV